MAETVYASAEGFIEFDVEERQLDSEEDVLDFTIRTPGTQDSGGAVLIRGTIWPELLALLDEADARPKRHDWVAFSGAYSEREVKGNLYRNINVRRIAIGGQTFMVDSDDRKVVKKKRAF